MAPIYKPQTTRTMTHIIDTEEVNGCSNYATWLVWHFICDDNFLLMQFRRCATVRQARSIFNTYMVEDAEFSANEDFQEADVNWQEIIDDAATM